MQIWPEYLHAVCCRNAAMELRQNRLKASFGESGVFLARRNNGMSFLSCVPLTILDQLHYNICRAALFWQVTVFHVK